MKSKPLFIGGLFIIALIMLVGSFADSHGKINLHDESQVLFILASIFYTINAFGILLSKHLFFKYLSAISVFSIAIMFAYLVFYTDYYIASILYLLPTIIFGVRFIYRYH